MIMGQLGSLCGAACQCRYRHRHRGWLLGFLLVLLLLTLTAAGSSSSSNEVQAKDPQQEERKTAELMRAASAVQVELEEDNDEEEKIFYEFDRDRLQWRRRKQQARPRQPRDQRSRFPKGHVLSGATAATTKTSGSLLVAPDDLYHSSPSSGLLTTAPPATSVSITLTATSTAWASLLAGAQNQDGEVDGCVAYWIKAVKGGTRRRRRATRSRTSSSTSSGGTIRGTFTAKRGIISHSSQSGGSRSRGLRRTLKGEGGSKQNSKQGAHSKYNVPVSPLPPPVAVVDDPNPITPINPPVVTSSSKAQKGKKGKKGASKSSPTIRMPTFSIFTFPTTAAPTIAPTTIGGTGKNGTNGGSSSSWQQIIICDPSMILAAPPFPIDMAQNQTEPVLGNNTTTNCTNDVDCLPGSVCVDTQCQNTTNPDPGQTTPPGCTSDADCVSESADMMCTPDGTCRLRAEVECTTDEACHDVTQFKCDLLTYNCVLRNCVISDITDTQCCADTDCGFGQICVSNFCISDGNPRFTLSWFGDDDLDLFVKTPEGVEIFFGAPYDDVSGGVLDQDSIPFDEIRRWTENVVFPLDGSPPPGIYEYWVQNSGQHGSGNDPWMLTGYFRGNNVTHESVENVNYGTTESESVHYQLLVPT